MSVPALALAPVLIDPARGPERTTDPNDDCSTAPPATTTTPGSPGPPPPVAASARSACTAPSATSTPPPARSCAPWTPSRCPTRCSTPRAGTAAPPSAPPAPRPTAATPTSSSAPGSPAARRPRHGAHPPVRVRHLHRPLVRPGAHPPHRPGGRAARCRPRRKADLCQHGRRLSCGQRHKDTDPALGRPLCPDCYDYAAAVVWNAHAPELWRRTTIAIRRQLVKTAKAAGPGKCSWRMRRWRSSRPAAWSTSTPSSALTPPPRRPARPARPRHGQLLDAIQAAAASIWFATVAHPARPQGWDIRWGAQLDTRIIQLPPAAARPPTLPSRPIWRDTPRKRPRRSAPSACRITAANVGFYGDPHRHQGRLIRAAWHHGSHTPLTSSPLPWAHTPGYPGHFATKSRRYSTTFRALRAARADYRRRQRPKFRPTRARGPGRRHHRHPPGMGRDGLAHHRRRPPGPLGRRPRPRPRPGRPRPCPSRLTAREGETMDAQSPGDLLHGDGYHRRGRQAPSASTRPPCVAGGPVTSPKARPSSRCPPGSPCTAAMMYGAGCCSHRIDPERAA